MMENEVISAYMANDSDIGQYYRGLYSVSDLNDSSDFINPGTINLIIVNTATTRQKNGHFLLIMLSPKYNAFFDSLNEIPGFYSQKLDKWLDVVTEHQYKTVPYTFQQNDSSTCGYYCLVWSKLISLGKPWLELFKGYEKNDKHYNDIHITKLFKKMFKHNL